MTEQVTRIIEYVKKFNTTITPDLDDLVLYSVEATIDRVLLYLNHEELDVKFERVVADIVFSVFTKYRVGQDQVEQQQGISSLSDNGQSVSYANEVRTYFTTASDAELLSGFVNLLSRYRRIRVVHPE